MEEEMRQGMMGADVQQAPAENKPMELNIPQFRNFMSKVFGSSFGMIMQEAVPEPQVSQPSETPAPTQGQGMMTQPPSA